jgi:hypothetical protein
MKAQSQLIIISSVVIAFMVAACEIKIMPPANWEDRNRTANDPVPAKAQVSLGKIAVGVVEEGWETINITAMDKMGEPDKWTVRTNDEKIAKAWTGGNQITVEGVKQGQTTLVITSDSGVERNVPVLVYSPMELDVGDLTIRYVSTFVHRYNDRGSGGKYDGSFWHPVMPDPSWHALGSLGFKRYYNPNGKHWMIIVKESEEGSGALKKPLGYMKEWENKGKCKWPHEGKDCKRGDHYGSFWTPKCPNGYVAMGTVVVGQWANPPQKDDVMCVRRDLTKPGEVGDFVWNDSKTGVFNYLGAWRITIPDISIHKKAYLETGTFVGRGNHRAGTRTCENDDCWEEPVDHPVMHVLSVSLPTLIDTPVEPQIPKLTGYEQPALTMEPLMQKSMLVPFSALLEGKQIGSADIEWLLANSPFVRVDRTVHNKLMFHTINNSSLIQENHIELVSGISETDSKTMTHTVGVSISHEAGVEFQGVGGKTSVTASYQFGYETMHAVTELQEKHIKVSINVPFNKAAACWQQKNIYRVMRHNKGELDAMADLEFGIDTYVVDEYPD